MELRDLNQKDAQVVDIQESDMFDPVQSENLVNLVAVRKFRDRNQ